MFRACYARFRQCLENGPGVSRVSLEHFRGADRRYVFARKVEDYMADFSLVSRRVLDQEEYKVFRYHFLLGADWRLCCRYTGLDRGNFFHYVYRIEQKLGRAFRELEPYPLFPLDEYFGGVIRRVKPAEVIEMPKPAQKFRPAARVRKTA
ncbi:MAG: hypothetical protein ACE15B_13830 [Bryobacteraceae bacterium]